MIALFELYPQLRARLPHVLLADLPTPVERMARLESAFEDTALFVKRDDLTGAAYGGNKVRKLEFLLGEAQRAHARTVITFGAAGSNHALATEIYAKLLDLRCVSMLCPQANAESVQRNLLMGLQTGQDLHYYASGRRTRMGLIAQRLRYRCKDGKDPMIIPAGGSNAIGIAGFVNAAFELKAQIEAGLLPEPDFIYAASGTMGTVVGLLLGVAAAGLRTHIMAVRVTTPPYTSEEAAHRLFEETSARLADADPAFPRAPFPEAQFTLRNEFLGPGYARYTEEGIAAVRRAKDEAGLKIEGTYTGKAFAALLADAASGALRGKTALFWNTYNSRDFSQKIEGLDYHALPKGFHPYFETPLTQ